MRRTNKGLDYYLSLPYPVTIYPDPDGGYFAKIKDLPGCMSDGDTLEEVWEMITGAKELWIKAVLDQGMKVPLPTDYEETKPARRAAKRKAKSS